MMPRTFHGSIALSLLLLCACSKSSGDADNAPPAKKVATEVAVAMPVQRAFPTLVEAFGTFAGDSRHTQMLSLPQAGQVVAADVTPGRRVKRGESLLRLATDPATRSTYQQARSALDLARGDLDRNQRLHAEHLATNAQLAAAQKALADAQSALAAQGRLGGAQDVAILSAPADGVVTAVAVALGERVPAGAKLIEFTPQHALSAQLGVAPEDAAKIHPGMPVLITPVYGGGTRPLQGRVAVVAAAVDPQTHLIDVLADVDAGKESTLAAGTALNAHIEIAQQTAWAVPRDALLGDDQGHYVLQIHQGKAHRVEVEVPSPAGDTIGVTGALDAADPVITQGAYELADGDAVRAQAASGTAP
ncbi:MAG: efflux RND transporter periplasmic adaptor subunit [Dokdonella sp.]